LVGYENFRPEADSRPDPAALIKGISSEVMLKLIAYINLALYGNDHNRDTFLIQASALNAFITFGGQNLKSQIHKLISDWSRQQVTPVFYSMYSNLLFYDLIFKNFKFGLPRAITPEQLVGFFEAYLVINSNERLSQQIIGFSILLQMRSHIGKTQQQVNGYHVQYKTRTNEDNSYHICSSFFMFLQLIKPNVNFHLD